MEFDTLAISFMLIYNTFININDIFIGAMDNNIVIWRIRL